MPRFYCTLFDSGYLARGLTLASSLQNFCAPFRLYVLCMDTLTASLLAHISNPDIEIVPIATLEREDPELASARQTRSAIEYYFTCKSSLMSYLLAKLP